MNKDQPTRVVSWRLFIAHKLTVSDSVLGREALTLRTLSLTLQGLSAGIHSCSTCWSFRQYKGCQRFCCETRVNGYPYEDMYVLQVVGRESSGFSSSLFSVSRIGQTCPWGPNFPRGAQVAFLSLTSTAESMKSQQSELDWDFSSAPLMNWEMWLIILEFSKSVKFAGLLNQHDCNI